MPSPVEPNTTALWLAHKVGAGFRGKGPGMFSRRGGQHPEEGYVGKGFLGTLRSYSTGSHPSSPHLTPPSWPSCCSRPLPRAQGHSQLSNEPKRSTLLEKATSTLQPKAKPAGPLSCQGVKATNTIDVPHGTGVWLTVEDPVLGASSQRFSTLAKPVMQACHPSYSGG